MGVLDTSSLTWNRLDLQPGSLHGRIGAQLTPVAADGRVETFLLFGGMAEAGPKEITMDDLWCISEVQEAESNKRNPRWSCLVPLSSKTRTWFPDNDADSSDSAEEKSSPSAQAGSASVKGKGKARSAPAATAATA